MYFGALKALNDPLSVDNEALLINIEKGLANMHATDKSDKSSALARLSQPQGPFRASIAWFSEHR